MNTGKYRRTRLQGTTLVFALVILAVAAMVLAGLVFTMGALVEHTVASETAMSQRLSLENSRALALQFAREKLLSSGSSQGVTNSAVASGGYSLGGLSLTGLPAWAQTNRPAGPNPFSPAGDMLVTVGGVDYYYSGFSGTVAGSLYSGTNTVSWVFETRTRTPTLGYDLANFFNSGTSPAVVGSASFGTTNGTILSGTLQNSAFPPNLPGSAVAGLGESSLDPNFLSGSAMAGATSIPIVSGTVTNTEYMQISGTVWLYLNGTNAATTYAVSGSLRQLILNYNGPYAHYPTLPLRIVCSNVVSSTISLPVGSDRPVYFIHSSAQPVSITYGGTPDLTLLLVNSHVTIQSGTIRGGLIRTGTGGSLAVSGGTLRILRETDPGTLDDFAIRRGWVESYRND
jgi:hypothetical protein